MELPHKTRDDALHFADTIENEGDRELFIDLFDQEAFVTIAGHFPAFYEIAKSNGDFTPEPLDAVTTLEAKPKATPKPKKVK